MVQLLLPCPWRTRTAEPRSSVLAAPGKFIADDVESMVEDRSHCVDTDCESIVWHADHHLQAALFQQYNTVINRDAWLKLEVPATSLQCACRVAKDLHPLEFKKSLKELETIEAITKVPNPAPADKPLRGSMFLCSATAPSNFCMLVSHISMFVQPIAWGWLGANTGIDLLVTKGCPPQQAWTSGISVDIPPDGSSTERGADSSSECARSLQLLSCFVKLRQAPAWHDHYMPLQSHTIATVAWLLLTWVSAHPQTCSIIENCELHVVVGSRVNRRKAP